MVRNLDFLRWSPKNSNLLLRFESTYERLFPGLRFRGTFENRFAIAVFGLPFCLALVLAPFPQKLDFVPAWIELEEERCSSLVRVPRLDVHDSRALRSKMKRACDCSREANVRDMRLFTIVLKNRVYSFRSHLNTLVRIFPVYFFQFKRNKKK